MMASRGKILSGDRYHLPYFFISVSCRRVVCLGQPGRRIPSRRNLERLMGRIIEVDEVQGELDRAARDAKQGTADVRAGRFVHRDATTGKLPIGKELPAPRSSAGGRTRK